MRSLSDALAYPTEDEDWLRTVAIGGVLTFLSFLIVPLFIVYGYVVRVIRTTTAGDTEPPVFEEWGDLVVEGLKMFVILLIYLLVPILVAAFAAGGAVATAATGGDAAVPAAAGTAALGVVVSFLLALVFGYVGVAGVVNFAREEEFGAAFQFGTLADVVTDSGYAVAWLLSAVVFVGVGVLNGVLGIIPVLGTLIGSFVLFYAWMVAGVLWADGVADALEDDAVKREGTAEEVGWS